MQPERFQQLIDLVGDALEQSADVRDVWLVEHTAGDGELLAEARSLLAQSDSPGDARFTAQFEAGLAHASADVLAPDRTGERAGAYRLIEAIGHGGMGSVYLAERDDEQYRARVAIKFVRGALAAPDLERRLRAERQILADLDHPNIARLLDGGTAQDGTPFLVMEYLDGQPIDAWCDAHALDVEARVRLFLHVCDAVAYAHRAHVIHRDIKPSNILVTAAGTPKLVDFGIARLLDGNAPHVTATMRVLTPAYASPEQMLGQAVGVPADVYGLGMVLYELLAGRGPYNLDGATAGEAERLVTRVPPDPPSVAAAERALSWRRDVEQFDDVVMYALRKRPDARPASADALASELRRVLELSTRERRAVALRLAVQRTARHALTRTLAGALVLLAALSLFARARGFAPVPRIGAFQFLPAQPAPALPQPYVVLAADVNGDQRADLVWNSLANGSNTTVVLFADRSGAFTAQPAWQHEATPPEGWAAYTVFAGDFNADGRADLLWQHDGNGANRLYVGLSRGDGSFDLRPPHTLGPSGWSAAWFTMVGDIDGDGKDDVVYNLLDNANSSYTAWSKGDGSFTLDTRLPHRVANWRGYRAFVADADGDGRKDIIWNDVPTFDNRTYVARSRGRSFDLLSFQDHAVGAGDSVSGEWRGYTTFVADINRDRRADLVWVNTTADPMTVQRAFGERTGEFRYAAAQTLARPPAAQGELIAALADFNGDGRADLLLRERAGTAARFWIALAGRTGDFRAPVLAADAAGANDAGSEWMFADIDGDKRADVVRIDRSSHRIRLARAR